MSCQLPHSHNDPASTRRLCRELEDASRFSAAAEMFRQLADPVRIRIFWILSHREECVINIAALLHMSSPAVSHHLQTMKEHGLLESRREGKEVYYRLADREECLLLLRTVEQVVDIACPVHGHGGDRSLSETVQAVHDYLLEHLAQRLTIEELSRRFLISPTALKKAFRQQYGMSIAAHTQQHRMEKAAQLLQQTKKSVAEVARLVGFQSQSRFTAVFKKHFGYLPTDCRRGENPSSCELVPRKTSNDLWQNLEEFP